MTEAFKCSFENYIALGALSTGVIAGDDRYACLAI